MSILYILQLEDDKWYVGKTDDVQKRFEQHKTGKGAEWTKLYKPVKIVSTHPVTSIHDETNFTKDLMKKYGVDNVRGGAYCQTTLQDNIVQTIKHELNSGADKCYNCGQKGHFANRCPNNQEESDECWQCDYCEREFDTEYGCMIHERTCKIKHKPSQKQSGVCYRCGRSGHYSPECYARTHVKGYELDD